MLMCRTAACFLLLLLAAGISAQSHAQPAAGWPTKPIRVVVPFPAGGVLDVVTRVITDRLTPALGQPVVIDVRPGADGNIGTELAARAAPDGYTLLAASPPTTIQPSVRPKTLRYDPLRDFEGVAFIGTSPFLFVVPSTLPVTTFAEFVSHARAQPGKLSYAGSARGTVVHLATEVLRLNTGIQMEMINYPGQPTAIADLLTGRVQFMTLGMLLAQPHLKSGKLRALAILEMQRHPQLPAVPSVAELGQPNLAMSTWYGLAAPRGTPRAVIDRINEEVMKVLRIPEVIEKLASLGADPARPGTPADFDRFMREDVARWQVVVKQAGIPVD